MPVTPRPKHPHPVQLQARDKRFLEGLYEREGLLSRRQIVALFFDGNWRVAKRRLRHLFEDGYIGEPSEEEVHRLPRKDGQREFVHWLEHKGLAVVAGLKGEEPLYRRSAPKEAPQWLKIEHDLALNDFRIAVETAVATTAGVRLGQWINEKTIKHWNDTVTYPLPEKGKTEKKFLPDGFFTILRPVDASSDEEFAFFPEIDLSTHSNPAFAMDKVLPWIAFLTSPLLPARYGVAYGRFLVVTEGGERLANMLHQTARVKGGEVFYFTTFAQVTPETVLTAPIWLSIGKREPFALLPPVKSAATGRR